MLRSTIEKYLYKNRAFPFVVDKKKLKCPWQIKGKLQHQIINPNFIHHILGHGRSGSNRRKRKIKNGQLLWHCNGCGRYLEYRAFYKKAKRSVGIMSICKECNIADRIKRKGYLTEYYKKYRVKHIEKIKRANRLRMRNLRKVGAEKLTDEYIRRCIAKLRKCSETEVKKEWIRGYRKNALEKRKTGWIYFFRAEKEAIKIGYSKNGIEGRKRAVQTGNHRKIKLIGSIPGGISLEKRIQKKFKKYHLHGEWFEYNIEIAEFPKKYSKGAV